MKTLPCPGASSVAGLRFAQNDKGELARRTAVLVGLGSRALFAQDREEAFSFFTAGDVGLHLARAAVERILALKCLEAIASRTDTPDRCET